MIKQPIILKLCISGATPTIIMEAQQNIQNSNIRNLIDGFDLIILPIYGENTDLELLYPIYQADEELLKIQSENIKLLNRYLMDKLNPEENI